MQARGAGVALGVLSAVTFGTSGSLAEALEAGGWSPGAAVMARIGIAALVLTPPAIRQMRGRWRLARAGLPAIGGYGLLAIAAPQVCYFNAVEHVTVGIALLLEYSGLLFVVIWMWLRHGQRPTRLTAVGIALAVVGLVLVLNLTGAQRVAPAGIAWGLGAGVGLACYFVISAHTHALLPPLAMAWSGLAVSAVALTAAGLVGALPMRANTAAADFNGHRVPWWAPVLGLSLVAAVVAYTAGIGAARRLGARLASFVGLLEVLAAVLFAWALLGQRPTVTQGIGGIVVLAGIVAVRAGEPDRAPA
ncbi:MAG: DMT family transporter [Actinomycetia bacterium]|nr:DMT family transporter [Actinomycetes bacterium]